VAVTFHVLSLHRAGSKMLCGMLDSHPDIACPHEPGNQIQNRLHLYPEQIEIIRTKTEKKIVGYHHHNCFTTDEMLNDKFPSILIHKRDECSGAIAEMNLQFARPNRMFTMNKKRVKARMKLREKAIKRMQPHADIDLILDDIVDRPTNTLKQEFADKILTLLELPTGFVFHAPRQPDRPMKPANLLEIESYVKSN